MSLTPEIIDAMVAAGLSRDQMAIMLKAAVAQDQKERAEKRAKAAAKKKRQRAEVELRPFDVPGTLGDIEGQEGTEGDNEGHAGTAGDIAAAAGKESPQTPIETTNPEVTPSDPKGSSVPKGTDRRRGHRIPDGFEHTPEARQVAADFGFVGDAADEALAEFADYWRPLPGLKATKLDWIGTLRNRLREVARQRARTPPRGPFPGQRVSGATAAALARRSEPTDAAPTLDLQPALRPFPGRRPEPAEPACGDDRAAGRDPARPHEDRSGTVHDLAARRAYG